MEPLELVHQIETIELLPTGDPAVHYEIRAHGSVLRSGYRQPMLNIKSQTPDAQGNLTYYFAAEPPVGGAPGNAVPIVASRYLFELQNVRKITIITETNERFV